MPGATTPDSIVYPVTGDVMAPLNSWFAQLAASTQTAMTALRAELVEPDLPDPMSIKGNDVQAVTATAWANLPGAAAISLTLPQACWVTITVGAWIVATQGHTRASASVTGATTLAETQLEVGGSSSAWGQVLYTDTTSATRQSSGVRTVRLNAGANSIQLRAYRGGTGVNQVNYSTLQVAPLRWA